MAQNKSHTEHRWRLGITSTIVLWACVCLLIVEAIILLPGVSYRKAELVEAHAADLHREITRFVLTSDPQQLADKPAPAGITQLWIYLDNGILLHQTGDEQSRPSDLRNFVHKRAVLVDDSISANWQIRGADNSYMVFAVLDAADVNNDLLHYTWRVIGMIVIIIFSLAFGVRIVVRQSVVKPIMYVVNAIDHIDSNATLTWGRDDEFQALINAYNSMIADRKSFQRQVRIKQNHLEYIAYNDSLTNLPNRRAFIDRVQSLGANDAAMIYIIGIDGFKYINDKHGSDVGDAIVAENGRRLATMEDERNFSARLEGDEFGLIKQLDGSETEQDCTRFAERILDALGSPHHYRGSDIQMTVSIGMARSAPDQQDTESAYKNASIALNSAKARGGNRYSLFDKTMREKFTRRASLLSAMENALEANEFYPVYQPKISLQRHQIVGVECLIRWRQNDGTIISPVDFIPLAEETGLIVPIGNQLLERSIKDLARWEKMGINRLQLAVNLSAVQLKDSSLPTKVSEILRAANFPVKHLELEITESAVMENPGKSIDIMTELNDQGISLAIDDFGTGYSSLSYLKQLPVNTLKIDQSFVSDICSDVDNQAIVKTVINLAHHFKLNVVAEGIETGEQLSFLKEMGCDIGQGYYFGKPMKDDDFIRWYRGWNLKSG